MSAAEGTLTAVGNMQTVLLQPGDVIVCSVDTHASVGEREGLRHQLQQDFPGHRIVVLSGANPRLSVWNEHKEPLVAVMARQIVTLTDAVLGLRHELKELRDLIVADVEEVPDPPALDGTPAGQPRDELQAL